MVREGLPFVIITFIFALFFGVLQIWFSISPFLWVLVALLVLLGFFMAFFFRDPRRTVPTEENIIVSAADGKVTRVEERENEQFVSVFLSPIDVHINRSPIAGKVRKIEYIAGKKNPATSNNASLVNERNALEIKGEKMTVVCIQIAGILARRIVCWSKPGDNLKLGEKFGLIKFSSRTDLLMPKNVRILVKIGDKVKGGETIIARLEEN